MTTPPMNESDKPVTQAQLVAELKATRADLRQEMVDMRGELRQEIANAMNYVVETLGARMDRMRTDLRDELSSELATTREDLSRELARHVTASAEQTQRLIIGLDDRYRDLPGRVTVLERELDEHRRDSALHPPRRRR